MLLFMKRYSQNHRDNSSYFEYAYHNKWDKTNTQINQNSKVIKTPYRKIQEIKKEDGKSLIIVEP